jgi:hypothetical protein
MKYKITRITSLNPLLDFNSIWNFNKKCRSSVQHISALVQEMILTNLQHWHLAFRKNNATNIALLLGKYVLLSNNYFRIGQIRHICLNTNLVCWHLTNSLSIRAKFSARVVSPSNFEFKNCTAVQSRQEDDKLAPWHLEICTESYDRQRNTRCIGKFPDCYCLTDSVKEDEKGCQGHTSKEYCISLPRDTALWTSIVFTRVLFWLRVSFCLRWMENSSNVSASSFAWSSVNLLPKPLKWFVRLLENIL